MTKLYPYQREDVDQISEFGGRVLLCNSPGLGKTLETLTWAIENKIRRIVVVCPAILKYQWELQAAEHCNLRAEVLEGRKPTKGRLIRPPRLVIINYDILEGWVDFLRKLKPQLIIGDEIQAVKNQKAKRAKAFRRLCGDVPHIIPTSGTPITNRPAEFFSILNIMWPERFPSFWPFAFKFCGPKKKPWGWEFKGATKIPQLNKKLKRLGMIRRLKSEVLKDLPPKTRTVLPIPIDNRKEYELAESDFSAWLRKNWNGKKQDNAKKAYRLTQFGHLKRLAAKLKLSRIREMMNTFLADTDEKLIVYGIHKSIVRTLHETYPDISVLVNGEIVGRARQRALDQFKNQKRTRLFIANGDAAGVGLNLQFAQHVWIIELPWTPAQCEQWEGRVDRLGQDLPTFIQYIIARNTIETKLCGILQTKQKGLNAILDGAGRGDNLNILDQLTNSLMRGK